MPDFLWTGPRFMYTLNHTAFAYSFARLGAIAKFEVPSIARERFVQIPTFKELRAHPKSPCERGVNALKSQV